MVFNEIARTMVSAFEKRAVQLTATGKLQKGKLINSSQTDWRDINFVHTVSSNFTAIILW